MTFEHLGLWETITDTATGRGQFRFVLQPIMAILVGIRVGITDAKEGANPFVRRLITDKGRAALLREALRKVVVPFTIAVVLDGILQYLALGYVRPLAAIIIGITLIGIPFSIARALSNRIYRRSHPARALPA